MKRKPVSRAADKFVIRMPEGMRERFQDYATSKHLSMNTSLVQGMDSFLDGHAELQMLLAGTRLLQQQLLERLRALEQEPDMGGPQSS